MNRFEFPEEVSFELGYLFLVWEFLSTLVHCPA